MEPVAIGSSLSLSPIQPVDPTMNLSRPLTFPPTSEDVLTKFKTRESTMFPIHLQRYPLHAAVASIGGIQGLLFLLGSCPPSETAQCAVLGCVLQVAQEVRDRPGCKLLV